MVKCPQCIDGLIQGGTGCFICPTCQSIFDLEMGFMYKYKTNKQREEEGIKW